MTEYKTAKTKDLIPYARNARTHSEEQVTKLASSIREFGFVNPIIIDGKNGVIAGHGRLMAAVKLKLDEVPVLEVSHMTDTQKKAYILADNRLALDAGWDNELLKLEIQDLKDADFDIDLTGFNEVEIDDIDFDLSEEKEGEKEETNKTLSERFGIPPFSVFNAREGWWQDRKRAWISLGIKSEEGRDIKPTCISSKFPDDHYMAGRGNNDGGSIFDPVLCEIAYRWFSKEGHTVLDPFAGGSVRGIVAGRLGRKYVGVDLRKEQIDANIMQSSIETIHSPDWRLGDSKNIDDICSDISADMIFTCPPYADLEVYSDDPADISNMKYDDFKTVYFEIIKKRVVC